ncbi:MAG: SDR family oxidoreductase [Chloroflexi bacterium]|nr:SDR family oxidoreductase [Chloroflexota bacterium]
MDLHNKVVIITGASSGIGLEIARVLAASGARLLLSARRADKLLAAQTDLQAAGAEVAYHVGDVTSEADCRAIVGAAVGAFGTVDVLVNNAGWGPPKPLLELDEDFWDKTLNACLKSVYLMTRAALPTMLEKGGGTIVQISSVAGKHGYAERAAYCAAKWGVQGFTESLKDEFGDQGIRAHVINPGAVATPWWENTDDAQTDEVMARMIPVGAVAEAVRWVLSQPDMVQIDEVVMRTFRSPWAG